MLERVRAFFRGSAGSTKAERQRQERWDKDRQQGRDMEGFRILEFCKRFGIAIELEPDGFPSRPTRDALIRRLQQEGTDQITIHEVRVGVDEHYWIQEEWAGFYGMVIPPLGKDPNAAVKEVVRLFNVYPGLAPMVTGMQDARPELLSSDVHATLAKFFREYGHPFVPAAVAERVWLK